MTTSFELLCAHCNATNPRSVARCITCGSALEGALPAPLSAPLIGRSEERAALLDALDLVVRERSSRFIAVSGESGVGKSRLMREVLDALARDRLPVYTGRGYADKRNSHYWLLRDILSHLFGFTPRMGRAERRARVAGSLETLLGASSARRSEGALLYLLGLSTAEAIAQVRGLTAAEIQQQLVRALQTLLILSSEERPLAILIDDAQWMDQGSARLLRELLKRRSTLRMLLVTFSRPGAGGREPFDRLLAAAAPDHRIDLAPLDEPDTARMLAAMLGWEQSPATLSRLLLPRAGGSPLMLEQMVRHFIERNILYRHDGGWQFDERATRTAALLPLDVRGMLLRRIDRLPTPARVQLEMAAVIGTRLEREVLHRAIVPLELGWPGRALDEALAVLVERGFLRGESADRLRFEHDRVQETVLDTIAPDERVVYHTLVASALESMYPDPSPTVVARLARHYSEGDDPEKAAAYLRRVVAQADDYTTAEQAITFFRVALERFPEALGAHPDLFLAFGELLVTLGRYDHARALVERGLARAEGSTAARLHLLLGMLEGEHGRYDAAETSLARALDLAGESDGLRGRIFSELGWVEFRRGGLEAAERHLSRALAQIPDGAAAERARAFNRLGGVSFARGDLERARDQLGRAMDAISQAGDQLEMANTHNNLGVLYMRLRDYPRVIEHREHALRLFEQVGNVRGRTASLIETGQFYAAVGRFEEAMPLLEEGLQGARDAQLAVEGCYARCTLGWVQSHLAGGGAGLDNLRGSLDRALTLGQAALVGECSLRLAEVLLFEARHAEAEPLVERLFETTNGRDERLAAMWRLRGRLALDRGQHEAAEIALARSIEHMDDETEPLSWLLTEAEVIRLLVLRGEYAPAERRRDEMLERWQRESLAGNTLPPQVARRMSPEG